MEILRENLNKQFKNIAMKMEKPRETQTDFRLITTGKKYEYRGYESDYKIIWTAKVISHWFNHFYGHISIAKVAYSMSAMVAFIDIQRRPMYIVIYLKRRQNN